MQYLMQYVITYFPEFRKASVCELEKSSGKLIRHLSENMSIIESSIKPPIKNDTVFIRHIMPINATGFASNHKEKALPVILEKVKEIAVIPKNSAFSVQCRIICGEKDYSSKDVEVFVGTHFDSLGAVPVFSDYDLTSDDNINVISILIIENELFCGFSKACENLNFHSDEYRVLSRKKGREISRAENKLKEAIHKFGIKIEGNGLALDIGASPGGWSKVLADYGYTVYAVDPGDLHPSLNNNKNIRHFKSKIEDLIFENKFEIVVNDMNVEPQLTADIMNILADNLINGAYAVVTLKLPFSDIFRSIDESLHILDKNYELLALKNLTHNRREVTALLRRR